MKINQYVSDIARLTTGRTISKTELKYIRPDNLRFFSDTDIVTGDLLTRLDCYFAANHKEVVNVHRKWPTDWWQAFRKRWFPRWWLRRHPVVYDRIDLHKELYQRICPHLDTAGNIVHIKWLCTEEDNTK